MTMPALSSHAQYTLAAMAGKVVPALNRLGADRDLDSADAFIDYFDDTQGIAPLFNPTPFNNASQCHNNKVNQKKNISTMYTLYVDQENLTATSCSLIHVRRKRSLVCIHQRKVRMTRRNVSNQQRL